MLLPLLVNLLCYRPYTVAQVPAAVGIPAFDVNPAVVDVLAANFCLCWHVLRVLLWLAFYKCYMGLCYCWRPFYCLHP